MNVYYIRYKDENDPGCPEFSTTIKGHDAEHAELRFYEAIDSDGWKILSVERFS